jgi:hypothetical protein
VATFFTVLAVLHVDEPKLDLESSVLLAADPGLDLGFGIRDVTLGDAGAGVEGAVGIGVGLLDATTLGFLAFLLLIFSSSSEEGYGEMDSRPLEASAFLAAVAAFLLCTELALNDGARLRACRLSSDEPQNESERRIRWTRGSGACICWSEEQEELDSVDARRSSAGREKRVLPDDEEPE